MILAFYDIAIFDKYFRVLGSDLRASPPPVCLTIECPPGKNYLSKYSFGSWSKTTRYKVSYFDFLCHHKNVTIWMTLYVNFGTEKTHWLTQRESLFSKI